MCCTLWGLIKNKNAGDFIPVLHRVGRPVEAMFTRTLEVVSMVSVLPSFIAALSG